MSMTPREIVHELNRHIIGQDDAKRAVAIALRNRWREGAAGSAVDERAGGAVGPRLGVYLRRPSFAIRSR